MTPSLPAPRPMSAEAARVLVVDDNEPLRENIVEALELEGFPVEAVASAADALARLAEDPLPEVVLLDLMMPGMDGRELLGRIRSDPRLERVRVVMVTGASGMRAKLASADAVLMKPFGVADLLAALGRVRR